MQQVWIKNLSLKTIAEAIFRAGNDSTKVNQFGIASSGYIANVLVNAILT
jgi:hypothetical protein